MKRVFLLLCCLISLQTFAADKEASQLFYEVRSRLNAVKDYTADVKMKIDVSFMRIPTLYGKLYFKNPDKMKLERNGGISILPKKSISLTLNNLVPAGDATIIDAGSEPLAGGKKLRILKVVPGNDATDIILTKLWIDEERLLVTKVETTTRDNGTVKMDLQFGKYVNLALPDRIVFFIDVKDFKMPKGVTMDYDGGETIAKKETKGKPRKGSIQIDYLSYRINTGLSDAIFVEEKKKR